MPLRRACLSLGSFVRVPHMEAARRAAEGITVAQVGMIRSQILQVCPQGMGLVDEQLTEQILSRHPGCEIRFHANVQTISQRVIYDIIDFNPDLRHWQRLKAVHAQSNARLYSAHAGFRKNGSLSDLFDQQKRLTDFLRIPVALEGHYPTRQKHYLLDSWAEWQMMLTSGLPFVVDLSHAAIIARLSGLRNDELIKEMLASENCLEIHISGNDGMADQHRDMNGQEWWWPLLTHAHPGADIFVESIIRREHGL